MPPPDLLCSACNYDLRTLPETSRCPECGLSIAQSRHDYANRLAAGDPRFVGAVRSALDALILAHLIPVLDAFERGFPDFLGPWLTPVRQQLAVVISPSILAILACWRIATRERNRVERGLVPDPRPANYVLRVTAICWFLPIPLMYGPYNRTFFWSYRYVWLLTTLSLCIVPAHFLFYRRLRRLAVRLPSRGIARQVRIVLWLTFASILWAWLPKSLGDPGLIWGLRESPVPAAGTPWSLYDLVHMLQREGLRHRPRQWLYFVPPAAVSAYVLLVLVQFRLALRRSERAGGQAQEVSDSR